MRHAYNKVVVSDKLSVEKVKLKINNHPNQAAGASTIKKLSKLAKRGAMQEEQIAEPNVKMTYSDVLAKIKSQFEKHRHQ